MNCTLFRHQGHRGDSSFTDHPPLEKRGTGIRVPDPPCNATIFPFLVRLHGNRYNGLKL
ncbi:hypothetical protein M408DRAFT_328486 [Serendipita vermifera MAFF 305830]|uniref:Uncharacterized protein n=1 Tax=Serendipita vermifera MAFF 305830 TaxID=933852 RepID=A0A0C3BF78_SERVB|nr:hypothetical protein M408DRAFT_328486 [Serendipita vermifera MAFF 305830]